MHSRVEDLARSLHRCILHRDAAEALRLHACIQGHGLDTHLSLANTLVVALAQSGNISLAQQVFHKLASPDESSFHALITGYARHGEPHCALAFYQKMQQACTQLVPSIHTYVALLKSCAQLRNLDLGCEIHSDITRRKLLERNAFIGCALVDMYAKCGCLFKAQEVFDMLPETNIVSWTALIFGYADNGHAEEALNCFEKMQHKGIPLDAVTYVCSLKACASIGDIYKGQVIHADIIQKGLETDVVVGSTLVGMYVKCGSLTTAHEVFNKLLNRDVVLWSTLIVGYAEEGMGEEALNCYKRMRHEGICPDLVIFACIVKACACTGDMHEGQVIHAEIVRKGLERDVVVGSTLLVMYAKCGLLTTAHNVFDMLAIQDVALWSALIVGYAEEGFGKEALDCYKHMKLKGICPDGVIFVCAIKACGSIGAIQEGQEVHLEVTKKGLESDSFIASTLTYLYSKCGLFGEAQEVLNRNLVCTVVSWNALLAGYVDRGHDKEALDSFMQMQLENVAPDSVTFICTLKVCGSIGATQKGHEIHVEITKKGLDKEIAIGSTLVDMYMKCGSLPDAQEVFDKLMAQDVVSWNALISGYLDHGYSYETLDFIEEMEQQGISLEVITYSWGLKACGNLRAINRGLELHAEIIKKGLECAAGSSLVNMYVNCSSLPHAQQVFQELSVKDTVLWNILLVGFIDHECNVEALSHFVKMQHDSVCSDEVSFICGLKACGNLGMMKEGHEIYGELVKKGWERDVSVSNALADMYVNYGALTEAQYVFNNISNRNVASWNAVIIGYGAQGQGREAHKYFDQMQLEGVAFDSVTIMCTLKSCSMTGFADKGQRIHSEVIRRGFDTDVLVGNTLVDMYCKCGLPIDARHVFDKILPRTIASWNSLILGSVESGNGEEALTYFEQMHDEGIPPDEVTFIYCLKSCGSKGAMAKGQEIHTRILEHGLESDTFIGNTLIDMYAKCGLLDESQHVFDNLLVRTVYSWNALIAGYSQLGESEKIFRIFEKMLEEDIDPNGITFYSLLNSCNHTGEMDKCHMYFEAMSRDYDILSSLRHLTCLLHLLGRAGRIDEAVAVIKKMPYHPGLEVWHTVLGACRKWGDVEIGRQAFEQAVQLNEKNAAVYISMSNIYADIDLQEDGNQGWCNEQCSFP